MDSKRQGESEYSWGYRIGSADLYIPYVWRHYSAEFCKGYQDGRRELETLVESVSESRCFR